MSQTDKISAEAFFADLLLPLKHASMRRGVHYLSLQRSPRETSYWGAVVSRTGGLEKLTASRRNGPALLDALGQYWAAQNDPTLPKLLPELKVLQHSLVDSKSKDSENEQRVSDFVYPLF